VATEHFSLSWRNLSAGLPGVLHTAVSKKLLPRAVDRNRVKRLMREASRAMQLPSVQLLFRLIKQPTLAFGKPDRQCKRLLREELDRGLIVLLRRFS
jgi:RNase P protein component